VKKHCFKGIKTCDKKAIILFWATMAIKKHLNIAYVARSEETSWKMWHRQVQMTEIVFVFEDRIGFWSRIWMTDLRFACFCEWFLHVYRRYLLMFIDLIAWIHSIYINSAASSPGANKKFHASHYMKGLHEVVHRDEQAQGFMGLRWRTTSCKPFI
jgi:hypothetical protein